MLKKAMIFEAPHGTLAGFLRRLISLSRQVLSQRSG